MVKQAPEWNMTKQLNLGPKNREGHEEEHSRTSQRDAGAENSTFMEACSTGLFNYGCECKLPLLTDLFHENIKTAWLKYLNGEEQVPAGTAMNTA